ncbi:PDCD10 [Mytilus coruscus]|uniref:PDCD10 n=1 Tax=Mytilus coruscus TaxID=42192 RepID=A0A6J8ALV9_MYTCO|nr:PDCD10 [Mytilus coruscus]
MFSSFNVFLPIFDILFVFLIFIASNTTPSGAAMHPSSKELILLRPEPAFQELNRCATHLKTILSRIPIQIDKRIQFLDTLREIAGSIKHFLDAVNKVKAEIPDDFAGREMVEYKKYEFVRYSKKFSITLKAFFRDAARHRKSVFISANDLIFQTNVILRTVTVYCIHSSFIVLREIANSIKLLLDAFNKVKEDVPSSDSGSKQILEDRKKEFVRYSKKFSNMLKKFFRDSSQKQNVFLSANFLIYQTNVILRTVKQECYRKNQHEKGTQCNTSKTIIENLEDEIDILTSECRNDDNNNVNDDLIQTRLESKGKSFNDKIRQIYYNFRSRGIGLQHCAPLIKCVFNSLNMEIADLPSKTTACNLTTELGLIAKQHIGEEIDNAENVTMHRDATTKLGRHFYGVQITNEKQQTFTTGLKEVTDGKATTYVECTKTKNSRSNTIFRNFGSS